MIRALEIVQAALVKRLLFAKSECLLLKWHSLVRIISYDIIYEVV